MIKLIEFVLPVPSFINIRMAKLLLTLPFLAAIGLLWSIITSAPCYLFPCRRLPCCTEHCVVIADTKEIWRESFKVISIVPHKGVAVSLKKAPKRKCRSPFGGFMSAVSGTPFSWLSPVDWWVNPLHKARKNPPCLDCHRIEQIYWSSHCCRHIYFWMGAGVGSR